jgi:single-strand DNA-binding protein
LFDTTVTIVGNVLNRPEYRRLPDSQTMVANFKIASTARRFDRLTNNWVDGSTLRVRVNCWRRLAENVGECVSVGDPVIVTGRLFSRDWSADDGSRRTSYELDAFVVGHDLSRGRDTFTRQRHGLSTTTVEDDEAERHADGELSARVTRLDDRRRLSDREVTEVDLADLGFGGAGFGADADPFQGFRTDEPDVLATLTGGGPGTEDFPDAALTTAPAEDPAGSGPADEESADEDEEPEGDAAAVTSERPKRRRRTAAGV